MEKYQNRNKLAPVCLFTYNRLSETEQTVKALKKNYLAPESDLFIFSDGPKDETGIKKVKEVRQYIKKIDGFKSVTIYESPTNKGLANSIISGVSQIIEQYGKIIVLEDDLITSPNFLDFLNQALNFYNGDPKIHSISGFTFNLKSLHNYQKDFYLGYRASSLGWGTWIEKWKGIDWNVREYKTFKRNPLQQIKFMRGGSDMPRMLRNQMKGKIDSWAIRWCYHQFKQNLITVFASKPKINHIGDGNDATNASGAKKYRTDLDLGYQRKFNFDVQPTINKKIAKDFRKKFSVLSRLHDKFL